MPVKTRSQTKMENKNHLIACSVARDVLDEIISKIEEEKSVPKYFLTIWLADDPAQEHGRGRYFDSKLDALKRFEEIKEILHSCLIMEETDDYEKAIFTWRRDEMVSEMIASDDEPIGEEDAFGIIIHEGKEYMAIYKTKMLEDIETGEVYNWRWVMDEDCNHVGYWTGESIKFITKEGR